MSRHDRGFKPLSLAQHFEAPEDFMGGFGWLCGYSADTEFLDDAAERFTRQTRAQRAHGGSISLVLMLDPGNPQILPTDAPGVLHIPMKALDKRPFQLLHAKVALLGFRRVSDAECWQLRLIVSTGNWTRQTLEESLDLVWRIDLCSEDLSQSPGDSVRLACADMKAAWAMLEWLRRSFDTRILTAVLPDGQGATESSRTCRRFEEWVKRIEGATKGNKPVQPRFFDNRKKSLLDQLDGLIKATGSDAARNYLAMGSGFYEPSNREKGIPSVLEKIVATLNGKLTAKPDINVFVNPLGCQAVADSLAALNKVGWKVREAHQPPFFGQNAQRSLHAKFIFSASCRQNFPRCNSAWLYLGSGNLTEPGFTNKMSSAGGNLEAGVVFGPDTLYWESTDDASPGQILTNLLPIHWDSEIGEASKLSSGSDMPARNDEFVAAPVAWLLWHDGDGNDGGWLKSPPNPDPQEFEVMDGEGKPCSKDRNGHFIWREDRPRLVRIRWTETEQHHDAMVPVLDRYGRFAATALPRTNLDEAWWHLASFPMPPEDEDSSSEEEQEAGRDGGNGGPSNGGGNHASYPVRQMMQLVENIAAKQTALTQADWPTWCNRLEQCLIQAAGGAVIEEFVTLGINPLSPLRQPPFRPGFAETDQTPEGRDYEVVLERVEREWKVHSLRKIGDPS